MQASNKQKLSCTTYTDNYCYARLTSRIPSNKACSQTFHVSDWQNYPEQTDRILKDTKNKAARVKGYRRFHDSGHAVSSKQSVNQNSPP